MLDNNKSKSELIKELIQLRQELAQLQAERDRIEKESIQQKELLSTVIDALPLGIFVKDVKKDYRFIIWNTQMETLLPIVIKTAFLKLKEYMPTAPN